MGSSLDSRWEKKMMWPVHIGCVFFPSPPCLFKGYRAPKIQMRLSALTHCVLLILIGGYENGCFSVKQTVHPPLCTSFPETPASPLAHHKSPSKTPFSLGGKTDGSPNRGHVKTRRMMTFFLRSHSFGEVTHESRASTHVIRSKYS